MPWPDVDLAGGHLAVAALVNMEATTISSALVPGTLLRDTYVIQRRIAAGGMGEVYEATHVRMPGRLAIKVLAPRLASEPASVARFCREAAIASVLRHPHIVQVFDFDEGMAKLPFLVMECCRGRDLAQHLVEQGPLSLARVANVVRQIAAALEAAHAMGIVHGDVKPANVMLLEYEGLSDFVKVLDFGVSEVAGVEPRGHTGAVLGTPSYMAPEQAEGRGEEIDGRADQFSLAVLTYVLLTGLPPFDGQSTAEVLQQIICEQPEPLGARVPWRSTGVEQALARALSKRPGDRFARVSDFSRALADAAATVDEHDRARVASRRRVFQGCHVSNEVETVICLQSARGRDASERHCRREDVTIDALAAAANASMAVVA